ncbi:hypothetical protein RVBP21_1430 [Pseudomonas phage BRkr]|nr:hypothetical protein RVBP21_1430 [Pseudomonas phage BRkr]
MTSPFVMSRIHKEIADGLSLGTVDIGRKPLEFVFCTPSYEEFQELVAISDFVKQLGHDLKVFHGTLDALGDHADEFDYYMTAGNSYGHMTGGYDGALATRFVNMQKNVVHDINRFHNGELNVGSCACVQFTKLNGITATLLYTPTMRVPRRLPKGSDVPYLASKAALDGIAGCEWYGKQKKDSFRVLGCLMGTGTGVIPARVAVTQFAIALYNYTYPSNVEKLFKDGQRTDNAIRETWKEEGGFWKLRLEE